MNSVSFIYEDIPYSDKNINIRQNISNIDHCMEHGEAITIEN